MESTPLSERIISGIKNVAKEVDNNRYSELTVKIHDGRITVFDLNLKRRVTVN